MRNWWVATLLAGCQLGNFNDQVYWLELVDDEQTDAGRFVEHNFADARIRGQEDPSEDGVSVTVDRARSDGGLYVYVRRGADDAAFVHLQNRVLTGRVVDGELSAEWSTFDDRHRITEGVGLFRAEAREELRGTLAIEIGADGAGTLQLISERRRQFSESDVWDPASVGVSMSLVPAATFLELEKGTYGTYYGGVENLPDTVECLRDPCQLTVTDRSGGSFAIEAFAVPGGFEQFQAIDSFEPPDGTTTL